MANIKVETNTNQQINYDNGDNNTNNNKEMTSNSEALRIMENNKPVANLDVGVKFNLSKKYLMKQLGMKPPGSRSHSESSPRKKLKAEDLKRRRNKTQPPSTKSDKDPQGQIGSQHDKQTQLYQSTQQQKEHDSRHTMSIKQSDTRSTDKKKSMGSQMHFKEEQSSFTESSKIDSDGKKTHEKEASESPLITSTPKQPTLQPMRKSSKTLSPPSKQSPQRTQFQATNPPSSPSQSQYRTPAPPTQFPPANTPSSPSSQSQYRTLAPPTQFPSENTPSSPSSQSQYRVLPSPSQSQPGTTPSQLSKSQPASPATPTHLSQTISSSQTQKSQTISPKKPFTDPKKMDSSLKYQSQGDKSMERKSYVNGLEIDPIRLNLRYAAQGDRSDTEVEVTQNTDQGLLDFSGRNVLIKYRTKSIDDYVSTPNPKVLLKAVRVKNGKEQELGSCEMSLLQHENIKEARVNGFNGAFKLLASRDNSSTIDTGILRG